MVFPAFPASFQHRLDNLLGRQPALEVKVRREADLRIDHIVLMELPHEVCRSYLQGLGILKQRLGRLQIAKVIHEVPALGRRQIFVAIALKRHAWDQS